MSSDSDECINDGDSTKKGKKTGRMFEVEKNTTTISRRRAAMQLQKAEVFWKYYHYREKTSFNIF